MATPIIQSNGTSSGLGTSGQSRDDLVNGETITFTDDEGANSGPYQWSILYAPPGSSASLVGPTTASPTLTLDAIGPWRIECDHNSGEISVRIFTVKTDNLGMSIPAGGENSTEDNEGGNATGWALKQYENHIAIDALGDRKANSLDTTGAAVVVSGAAPPTTGQVLKATSATTATWQDDSVETTAEALGTTGANVDVGAAAPPTTGQALIASSATTATWQTISTTDIAVEVSANDTTPGGLEAKLSAGTNVAFNTLNEGANEQLEISVASAAPSGSAGGDLGGTYPNPTVEALGTTGAAVNVGAAAPPTTGQVLKATSATTATWQADAGGSDIAVNVSGDDTTAGDLETKLLAGDNVRMTTQNPGGNETRTIDAYPGLTPGPIELVETQEVTGSAVQNIDFTGLNGEVDERYIIKIQAIIGAGGLVGFQLQPNLTITANQQIDALTSTGAAASASETTTLLYYNSSTGDSYSGTIEFEAKTGNRRAMHTEITTHDTGAADAFGLAGGTWDDTATVVTGLRLAGSVASAFGVGTKVQLYRQRAVTPTLQHEQAQGDYIRVGISANQTALSATDRVEYDTTVGTAIGDLSLLGGGTADARITGLKAGRRYRVTWQANIFANGGSFSTLRTRLRDVTAATLFEDEKLATHAAGDRTSSLSNNDSPKQVYEFTPSVDTEIGVEVSAVSGVPEVEDLGSFLEVREIGVTAPTAQGETIHVTQETDQLNITSDTTILWDKVREIGGGLSLNGSGQIEGLKAGRSYVLVANLRLSHSAAFSATMGFYDGQNNQIAPTWSARSPATTSNDIFSGSGVRMFRPTQDTSVEVRYVSGSGGDPDVLATDEGSNGFQVFEVGTAAPATRIGWELADEILPLAAAQTADLLFGVGGDGNVNEALNGDKYHYMLEFHIERATGVAVDYFLEPNAVAATNYDTRYTSDGSPVTVATDLRIALANAAAVAHGKVEMLFESGRGDRFAFFDTGFDSAIHYTGRHRWSTPTGVLTSLRLGTDGAGTAAQTFGIGTWARLHRRLIRGTVDSRIRGEGVKTAAYTVKTSDELVPYDTSGGAFTITLFSGGSAQEGQVIEFKEDANSTNQLTLTAAAGQTIDGSATQPLTTAYLATRLVFDGVSNWRRM